MNLFLSLVLLVALLPANGFVQVRIVLVNTEHASISGDRDYVQHVTNAFAYWYRNSPLVVSHEIIEVSSIFVEDPFSSTKWLNDYGTLHSNIIDIYILANERELIYNRISGIVLDTHNAVIIIEHSTSGIEALLAHELGHAIYGIPDWYKSVDMCSGIDIMCFGPKAAYDRDMLGCLTLEYLGGDCSYVYLPSVNIP